MSVTAATFFRDDRERAQARASFMRLTDALRRIDEEHRRQGFRVELVDGKWVKVPLKEDLNAEGL